MSVLLFLILFLVPIIFLLTKRKKRIPSQNVPPGSLGLPFIGQSLSFLRAMRANTAEKWLQARATKYGHVSKLSLFGKPTVFIFGQAANKFVFTGDDSIINNQQAKSLRMILGDRCLLELSGEDHKRIRDALMSFLKPESLKQYIGKMDQEIRKHIQQHWGGHQRITVCLFSLNMDSKIFRAPTEFDPSRYKNQSTIPPYCYVPFGGGPRMCPGNEFARIETLVTIHHLATQFKWKLCCKDDFFSRDPMPVPTKGLPIEIVSKKFL